jgi:hypothetical protein
MQLPQISRGLGSGEVLGVVLDVVVLAALLVVVVGDLVVVVLGRDVVVVLARVVVVELGCVLVVLARVVVVVPATVVVVVEPGQVVPFGMQTSVTLSTSVRAPTFADRTSARTVHCPDARPLERV